MARDERQKSKKQTKERRYFPRIRVFGHVHGRPVPMEMSLELQDIGMGGFSIEGPVSFPTGTEYLFEFTATSGWAMLRATCVHCERASPMYGDVYFAGFVFTPRDEKDTQTIASMVGRVLASVS